MRADAAVAPNSALVVQTAHMASAAELLSLVTAIEEMQQRITRAADDMAGGPQDDTALELYEVERALRTARRKLSKVASEMPRT